VGKLSWLLPNVKKEKKNIHSYKITAVTLLNGNNFNLQVKHDSVIATLQITVDKTINIKRIWKR